MVQPADNGPSALNDHTDVPKPRKGARKFLASNRDVSVTVMAAFVLIFGAFGIRLLAGSHAASDLIGDDSKANCIYVGGASGGATMNALTGVERLTGMVFGCMEASNLNVGSWEAWETPWFDSAQYGYSSWVSAGPSSRQMVISQDLIPSSLASQGNPLGWEQSCDSGQYDSYAASLARNLVAAGFGNSVIRLGPEMNGNWEADSMGTTGQEMSDWAGCYVQEVKAIRAVTGANFWFGWNPNSCFMNEPLAQYYPGDAYVDVIGMDQDDEFCTAGSPAGASDATFKQLEAEPGGLDAITVFAKQHGKPMSLPQWGDAARSSGGFGDDASYTSGIGAYVKSNDVAFQSYFDEGDDGILQLSSQYPRSLAAYIKAFRPAGASTGVPNWTPTASGSAPADVPPAVTH